MKTSENFLEGMAEEHEPVDSPAYQWFVRFTYMPIVARLDEGIVCLHDLEFAFDTKDVSFTVRYGVKEGVGGCVVCV